MEWSNEYYAATHGALLPHVGLPVFQGKSLPRLREKALDEYARGSDRVYPPGRGDVPALNDLVRVRLVAKFLDGVSFLADKLTGHLQQHGITAARALEARETGYYAMHLYFSCPFLYRTATAETINVKCEVQIATELSTTIWDRTHGAYELARVGSRQDRGWQWDQDDPRFLAAQLAHMIHFADGIVMQLRDAVAKQKGGRK